ncbi:MAG: hypothetical protein WAZ94_04430 [Phycisphaerales bacterium]
MNAERFRALVLARSGSAEGCHMGHADFRAGGRIFACLAPAERWATLSLSPDDRDALTSDLPEQFEPLIGAWGRGAGPGRNWTGRASRLQDAASA